MQYCLEAVCISSRGKIRGNNEDNFFFDGEIREEIDSIRDVKRTFLCVKSTEMIFAVLDGMGGEANGEIASYAAAKCLREKFGEKERDLEKLCRLMNSAVCEEAEIRKSRYMGTTAALLSTDGETATACNVGDSRIYLFRDGSLRQLSYDHVDHRREGRKGSLTQNLGIPEEEMLIEPHILSEKIQTHDVFLLCSDGLTDMVSDEAIGTILSENSSVKAAVEKLYEAAMNGGGRDNITVILIKQR